MKKLKPCPFCGGEATTWDPAYPDTCLRMDIAYFASCKVCSVTTIKTSSTEKATSLWNTRQPVDNWKPIENIYDDSSITPDTNLIFCDTRITGLFDLCRANRFFDDSGKFTSKRLTKDYTHYALLTPPEV